MKHRMRSYRNVPKIVENDRRTLFSTMAVSFICHLILFVVLIFAPGYAKDRKPSLSFINVSLVTLPAQGKASLPDKQQPAEIEKQLSAKKKTPEVKISPKKNSATEKKHSKAISPTMVLFSRTLVFTDNSQEIATKEKNSIPAI